MPNQDKMYRSYKISISGTASGMSQSDIRGETIAEMNGSELLDKEL